MALVFYPFYAIILSQHFYQNFTLFSLNPFCGFCNTFMPMILVWKFVFILNHCLVLQ